MLLHVVDRRGLRDPETASDLLPREVLVTERAGRGTSFQNGWGHPLVDLLGSDKEVLELVH